MVGPEVVKRLHRKAAADRWDVPPARFAVALYASISHAFPEGTTPAAAERYLSSLQLEDLALATARAGLPFNMDTWDGYPSARARLLGSAQETGSNLVVLSGDSHNSWAFDLDNGGKVAGVEFAGTSVTSPGSESNFPGDPDGVARAFAAGSGELKWAETSRRGYFTVELTPERATGEFLFMDTVRQPSLALSGRHRMSVAHGTNRFAT